MKLTKSQLKQIIKEELKIYLAEAEGAIKYLDSDELIPEDHWTVEEGLCEIGDTVRDCMAKIYT